MKLARINTLLLILIVLVNGYTVLVPVLPSIFFKAAEKTNAQRSQLEVEVHLSAPTKQSSTENRLIIPHLLLDEQIFEGPNASTLRKGLWHRPQTSTPEQGGNTVVVGHRLTYTNPRGILYHLDKMVIGDSIGVTWRGKTYAYTVREVKVVSPAAVEIEAPTPKPQLTIYTCTPLWLPKDRLVVIATPENT